MEITANQRRDVFVEQAQTLRAKIAALPVHSYTGFCLDPDTRGSLQNELRGCLAEMNPNGQVFSGVTVPDA